MKLRPYLRPAALLLALPLLSPAAARAATSPSLGTAGTFAVLAGSTVTNTGPTTLIGDLGVSPGTAVTGFPPGLVSGATHLGDAVAAQAQTDATTAYNNAAGQPCDVTLTGQDLGGKTLTPGVYCFASSAQLTGQLILDGQGNPSSVFIFQIGSTLTTASNASVVLINGAQPCSSNIFWQVGSSATLGTNTSFTGNILALASITLQTGTVTTGGLYAHTDAVTLDSNNVVRNNQVCSTAPTNTATATPTGVATSTATPTGVATSTATPTGVATSTATPTTPAPTATLIGAATGTATSTSTLTPVSTPTPPLPAGVAPTSTPPSTLAPTSTPFPTGTPNTGTPAIVIIPPVVAPPLFPSPSAPPSPVPPLPRPPLVTVYKDVTRYHDVKRYHDVTRYHTVTRVQVKVRTHVLVRTRVRQRVVTHVRVVTHPVTVIHQRTVTRLVPRVVTRYRTVTHVVTRYHTVTRYRTSVMYHYYHQPKTGRFAGPLATEHGAIPPVEARLSITRLGIHGAPVWARSFVANPDGSLRYDIVPAYGVTRFADSAPLGQPGLSLMSGHDDIAGSIFRYLGGLRPGDTVVVAHGAHPYRYVVRSVSVVTPDDVRLLNAAYTRPTLALISCTPYGVDTHRVVVIAQMR